MPEKYPPEGSSAGLSFCGLTIASVALGAATSPAYGFVAFGLGLFLVGMIDWWRNDL